MRSVMEHLRTCSGVSGSRGGLGFSPAPLGSLPALLAVVRTPAWELPSAVSVRDSRSVLWVCGPHSECQAPERLSTGLPDEGLGACRGPMFSSGTCSLRDLSGPEIEGCASHLPGRLTSRSGQ